MERWTDDGCMIGCVDGMGGCLDAFWYDWMNIAMDGFRSWLECVRALGGHRTSRNGSGGGGGDGGSGGGGGDGGDGGGCGDGGDGGDGNGACLC